MGEVYFQRSSTASACAQDAAGHPSASVSARAAATGADVVLVAVRNAEQLEAALWGDDGVTEVLEPGSVVLLTSTVGIAAVEDVATRLADQGIGLVDAPVSGGPTRAGNGDLLVTVGAEDTAYDVARPVLEAMASTLRRVGDRAGAGQAMKTVNQLLCGVHIAAGAEALALADALGMRWETLTQADLLRRAPGLRAVVATLPPRAADALVAHVPADAALPPLLDAAYDPWPSVLAAAWSREGGPVASGLSMLLHQGVEQVRLFTARPRTAAGMPEPDWAAVTRAAADALGPAAG